MFDTLAILVLVVSMTLVQFLLVRRYINAVFRDPTVKKAFSIIGSLGGDSKRNNAIVQNIATDILSSPRFSALKMGADMLGFDFDSYVDKYGAVETLTGLNQLGSILGIDVNQLLIGGNGSLSEPSTGANPYFKGGR